MVTENFQVAVEKLVYGGEGLSHRGKPVLVSRVLPGELVEVQPVRTAKGVIHARPVRILEPAADRRDPPCPYFSRCGGCHYQHIPGELQVRFKQEILRDSLRRMGRIHWKGEIPTHTGEEWNYRNRAKFKLKPTPEGETEIGFFEADSHSLCSIEACGIVSPRINEILKALREFLKGRSVAGAKEIEVLVNENETEAALTLYGARERAAAQKLASELLREIPGLVSVGVEGRWQTPVVAGRGGFHYQVEGFKYWVSHGSFFQASRPLLAKLIRLVAGGEAGDLAIDLYAGVGLFSLPLARQFRMVYAVESRRDSAADLERNAAAPDVKNVRMMRETAEDFLRRFAGAPPSLVVLDPPRRGAGPRVLEPLVALRPSRLAYVSCDPATLARDLAYLIERGYELSSLDLVELFPQTFHIETVARLARKD
ncbi:MAG: 23S rRNA (uracil(1939)-C(5))-methyltransferase RlmD [Acidobacteriota bacterium]